MILLSRGMNPACPLLQSPSIDNSGQLAEGGNEGELLLNNGSGQRLTRVSIQDQRDHYVEELFREPLRRRSGDR